MLPYMSAELMISLFQLQEGLPNIEAGQISCELPPKDREHSASTLDVFEILSTKFVGQREK
jgi:hypothetical protein